MWKQQSVRRDSIAHMAGNVELHQGIIVLADNQRLIRLLEPLQVPGYRIASPLAAGGPSQGAAVP